MNSARLDENIRYITLPGDTDEDEVKRRFGKWKKNDPFPSIPPALLNSSNIYDYVCATGMIFPFHKECLSGASYNIRIAGSVRYFKKNDRDGSVIKMCKELKEEGDGFDLAPNSIAYVTLEPTFRVPDYIVLRFNLKITHIYKGLLLGTGPIVDPGFVGKLSIPLHNFTSNKYHFKFHDELIQMEFTKMVDIRQKSELFCGIEYIPNKIDPLRTVDDYLSKALAKTQSSYIISSIPDAMDKAKKDAAKAKKAAKKLESKADWTLKFNLLIIATIIISCMAICFATINSVDSRIDRLENEIQSMEKPSLENK